MMSRVVPSFLDERLLNFFGDSSDFSQPNFRPEISVSFEVQQLRRKNLIWPQLVEETPEKLERGKVASYPRKKLTFFLPFGKAA